MTGAKNRNSPSFAEPGEPSTSADQEINAEAFLNVADRCGKPSPMPYVIDGSERRLLAARALIERMKRAGARSCR